MAQEMSGERELCSQKHNPARRLSTKLACVVWIYKTWSPGTGCGKRSCGREHTNTHSDSLSFLATLHFSPSHPRLFHQTLGFLLLVCTAAPVPANVGLLVCALAATPDPPNLGLLVGARRACSTKPSASLCVLPRLFHQSLDLVACALAPAAPDPSHLATPVFEILLTNCSSVLIFSRF
jgi:hypothetical protein